MATSEHQSATSPDESTIVNQVLDDLSQLIITLKISVDISTLDSVSGLEKKILEVLRNQDFHSPEKISRILTYTEAKQLELTPTEITAAHLVDLYGDKLARAMKNFSTIQRSRKRIPNRKRRVRSSDEEDEDGRPTPLQQSTAPLTRTDDMATANHGQTVNISDEEEQEDDDDRSANLADGEDQWEDIADDEETDASIAQILQQYMRIESEKEAKKQEFSVAKRLDDDIAHICNSEPFDSSMSERTLVKELKRIPWIPNFEVATPPRWPTEISGMADESYFVRPKRFEESWQQYNRFKETQVKRMKAFRIREDRKRTTTQMLYVNQLRLAATLFQKTRTILRFYTQLLSHSSQKLDVALQAKFEKSLKGQQDLERLHTLQLQISKSLLAKATRDRRFTFIRNAGNLKQVSSQILNQPSVRTPDGHWLIIDPHSLGDTYKLRQIFVRTSQIFVNKVNCQISGPFDSARAMRPMAVADQTLAGEDMDEEEATIRTTMGSEVTNRIINSRYHTIPNHLGVVEAAVPVRKADNKLSPQTSSNSPTVTSGGDVKHASSTVSHNAPLVELFRYFEQPTRLYNKSHRFTKNTLANAANTRRTNNHIRNSLPTSTWAQPARRQQFTQIFTQLGTTFNNQSMGNRDREEWFRPRLAPGDISFSSNLGYNTKTNANTGGGRDVKDTGGMDASRRSKITSNFSNSRLAFQPTESHTGLLPFTRILYPTESNQMASDCRFATTKSIYAIRKVQDEHVEECDSTTTKRGLDVENRHQRSLYTYWSSGTSKKSGTASHWRTGSQTLLFGFGPAPRIFTKLMDVPMSELRRMGISISDYLDDLLGFERTYMAALRAASITVILLQYLGFCIAWKKCVLEPTQRIEQLGWVIDLKAIASGRKTQHLHTTFEELSRATNRISQENRRDPGNNSAHEHWSPIRSTVGPTVTGGIQRCSRTNFLVPLDSSSIGTRPMWDSANNREHYGLERDQSPTGSVRLSPSSRRVGIRLGRKYFGQQRAPVANAESICSSSLGLLDEHSAAANSETHQWTEPDRTHPHLITRACSTVGNASYSSTIPSTSSERQTNSPALRQCSNSERNQSSGTESQSIITAVGTEVSRMDTISERDTVSSVDSRFVQPVSRFRFKTTPRSERLDATSVLVSPSRSDLGTALGGPLCIGNQSTTSSVLFMEPRSVGVGGGRFLDHLDSRESVGQSSLVSYSGYHSEASDGTGSSNARCPGLADTTMVSLSTLNVNRSSNSPTPHTRNISPRIPAQRTSNLSTVLAPDSNLAAFRECHRKLGIPSSVVDDATNGWRDRRQLERVNVQFRTWLRQRALNPVENCTIPFALDYLRHLHDEGLAYSQLRSIKCALSSLIGESPTFGFRKLGDLWITKQVLKAYREGEVSNIRYERFWEPSIIHNYFAEETPPLEEWTLKWTTKALAYLLKEGAAGRSSDIVRMDISTLRPASGTDSEKFSHIHILKPKETGRATSKSTTRVRRLYRNYQHFDPRVDWRRVLQHYEEFPSVRKWRSNPSNKKSALLTFGGQKLGLPPSADTVTRWVAEVLWLAGIPDCFTPHSVRGAVITQKIKQGVEEELSGLLSNKHTRQTYYDRSTMETVSLDQALPIREERKNMKWAFRTKEVQAVAVHRDAVGDTSSEDGSSGEE